MECLILYVLLIILIDVRVQIMSLFDDMGGDPWKGQANYIYLHFV